MTNARNTDMHRCAFRKQKAPVGMDAPALLDAGRE